MGNWRFCEVMIVRRVEFSEMMEKQSRTHLVLLHFFACQ